MARRKQLPVSMSNKVLRGCKSKGVESKFKDLGEKGLAVYFLLLRRMNGENTTWITIGQILNAIGLQRRDKKEIIRILNFLHDEKLIILENKIDNIGNNDELEIYIETDLEDDSYTTFYPNNFKFYEMVGTKGFTLFCMIESFIGTKESAYCTIDTLVELTGFSENTVLEQIFILGELGVFNVEYGEYNTKLKRNENNSYFRNKVGRIKLLDRTIDEVKKEIADIKEKYKERKVRRAKRIEEGIMRAEEREENRQVKEEVIDFIKLTEDKYVDNMIKFPAVDKNTLDDVDVGKIEEDKYSIPF